MVKEKEKEKDLLMHLLLSRSMIASRREYTGFELFQLFNDSKIFKSIQ